MRMARIYSHLNTTKLILDQYKGEMPFSTFLKTFFSKEKKYVSRDRKTIASFCYNYFRVGSALKEQNQHERLLTALFLLSNESNELLQNEKPEWHKNIELSLAEKLRLINFGITSIFPFNNDLSKGIDVTSFNISFLIQPDLFVRVRSGKLQIIKNKLAATQIEFTEVTENCLAFENGTKLESVIDINKEAVIQDANSQRVGEFLLLCDLPKSSKVWDCCAASGGKSIMAFDLLPDIQLTVSDVRQSIIHNLYQRFKEAGLKNYHSFVADLTNPKSLRSSLAGSSFDLIICDAPCSGSGTWSRTPEQLLFFKHEEIIRYGNLQKSIAANSISYLKKGGYFLYITCSVFEKENEDVVAFIKQQFDLTLVKMELLQGYEMKADTMFAALFVL
jgi:16S rRNA (cytosine967-C5)-methyltransferase